MCFIHIINNGCAIALTFLLHVVNVSDIGVFNGIVNQIGNCF